MGFFGDIALVLIDEVHLLNDPRGAALEAIVSRIKMLARNPTMKSYSLARVRFVGVSATIPNIDDLGKLSSSFFIKTLHLSTPFWYNANSWLSNVLYFCVKQLNGYWFLWKGLEGLLANS